MAACNDEAIQMAVDYLLSADGASPIEVQLSFLKSRMKMSYTDITEALRLTGLKPSSTAAGPRRRPTAAAGKEKAKRD